MNSDRNYPWLTDIEDIQAEIARDLELATSPHIADKQTESLIWTDDAPADTDIWDDDTPSVSILPPDISIDAPVSGFYRETIKDTPKKRRKRSWVRPAVAILLICTLGMGSLGFGLGAAYVWATRQDSSSIPVAERDYTGETPSIASNQHVFDLEGQTGTVADMVQLLEPAVVSITTHLEAGGRQQIAGSGTIFAENEDRIFIVTGNYVVPYSDTAGNRTVHNVIISGSRPLTATLVSNNRDEGLAVISIDKVQLVEAGIESVTIAAFGDSSQMQVGDTVFAIGNARNEGTSVTRGIISAGKQDIAFSGYTLTVLQTDAAINYGNSGGPLINMHGEVIGINIDRASARFQNATVEGIGYSIAANVVAPILADMIDFNRPGLGIRGSTLDEERAAYWGIPPMGVFVVSVTLGGSADVAGILPHDVITSFGGEPVFTMEELIDVIRRYHIGEIVEVWVLRDGSTLLTLEVQLQALVR